MPSTNDGLLRTYATQLEVWAGLSPVVPRIAKWVAVDGLVQAAIRYADATSSEFCALVSESDHQLSPLRDPLHLDVGLHRWLASSREEAYSDWLAWVLSQLPADAILPLLRISDAELTPSDSSFTPEITREGPAGTGRFDIALSFGTDLLIVIEVKKGSADEADTAKQAGYAEWIHSQPHRVKRPLLLVTEGTKGEYEGEFQRFLWADLCIGLRRYLYASLRGGSGLDISRAAMISAFVSAAEQNLLRLVPPTEALTPGRLLDVPRTAEHIRRSLQWESLT
jgi:hypothetical protein